MTDDLIVEQRPDRAELLVARHLWIDAVQLPKSDLVDAELLAALGCFFAQIVRPPVRLPHTRARALQPSLGGDEHAAIRMKRLADKLFGHVGAIGIRRVDEIDAERPAGASACGWPRACRRVDPRCRGR